MRRLNSKFITKYISEAGTKELNKDYFGFVEMDKFTCWAIAESYDNDNNIISAELAVTTVISEFTKKPSMSKRKLKKFIKEANKQLKLQSGKFELKASILVVVSNYNKIRYAVCGNCRLNIFRGNNILTKSMDTSLYQEMINDGYIPDDGIVGIEESRNLFSYLGKKGIMRIKISKKIKLQNDDILLMTTWGFWEKVTIIEMLDALEGINEPIEYLDELQDLYLSKQSKLVNNYTLAAVFVNKIYQEKSILKKIIKIIIIASIPIIIMLLIALFFNWRSNVKRKETIVTINEYENNGDVYIDYKNYDRALNEYNNAIKETKDLKSKKGKKGKENQVIKDNLNIKQRVSQMIIDADALFEKGKYEQAKQMYDKALEESKYDLEFYDLIDKENIENKKSLCNDYKYTNDLIALADSQTSLKDYESAIKTYNEAKTRAIQNSNKVALDSITLKIGELENLQKAENEDKQKQDSDKQQQKNESIQKKGENFEKEGDSVSKDGNYNKAIEYYNKAIEVYKEAQADDKVTEAEKKIIDANDSIKQQEKDVQVAIADTFISSGDNFMLENNFEEAVNNYKSAKDLYITLNDTEKIKEITEKINSANTRQKENEAALKLIEIGNIETKGDEALKNKDYKSSKEYYKQARALYQGINHIDKVLLIEEKIKGIDDIESDNIEEKQNKIIQNNQISNETIIESTTQAVTEAEKNT